MRWVVYDPPHLTVHIIKVAGMAKKPAICAECGLEGWNWKCAECGCESGIRQGSPGYGPAVNARAARMKGAAEGSPSMDTGQPSTSSPASESADQPAAGSTPTPPADSGSDPSTSSPASESADQPAAGSTPTPPADSGSDTLSTALSHLSGGEAAVFTGSARAASLGSFFVSLGWFLVVLSVIGGIAAMAITEPDPLSRYDDHHPYVLVGVVVLVSGSIQGFVIVMIGSFVQATLEFQSLVGGFFKRLKTLSL